MGEDFIPSELSESGRLGAAFPLPGGCLTHVTARATHIPSHRQLVQYGHAARTRQEDGHGSKLLHQSVR